ncbi:hypothetical protein BH11CYA1_BH11CYA1_28600 [soil metagenome]
MNRTSILFQFLRRIDIFVYCMRGLAMDYDRLDFNQNERQLFSDEGLLRTSMSVIPWTDRTLASAVRELGGWGKIVQRSFVVTDEVYSKLEQAGFSREQFDKSREYLADPQAYWQRAQKRRYPII